MEELSPRMTAHNPIDPATLPRPCIGAVPTVIPGWEPAITLENCLHALLKAESLSAVEVKS